MRRLDTNDAVNMLSDAWVDARRLGGVVDVVRIVSTDQLEPGDLVVECGARHVFVARLVPGE